MKLFERKSHSAPWRNLRPRNSMWSSMCVAHACPCRTCPQQPAAYQRHQLAVMCLMVGVVCFGGSIWAALTGRATNTWKIMEVKLNLGRSISNSQSIFDVKAAAYAKIRGGLRRLTRMTMSRSRNHGSFAAHCGAMVPWSRGQGVPRLSEEGPGADEFNQANSGPRVSTKHFGAYSVPRCLKFNADATFWLWGLEVNVHRCA